MRGIRGPYPTDEPYRQGACEYAMNPDCGPDSPADTVLLFETHAGWNRHGGPELFTTENYNPPGGLVLFNDGTVKFVRSQEELKQFRWKWQATVVTTRSRHESRMELIGRPDV